MNNEDIIDLSARLGLHEYLLEQLFANGALAAPNPQENWKNFSTALIDQVSYRAFAKENGENLQEIHQSMIVKAEAFCAKVANHIQNK